MDLPAPFGGSWNGGLAAPTLANIDADADLERGGTATAGAGHRYANTPNAGSLGTAAALCGGRADAVSVCTDCSSPRATPAR